VRCRLQASLTTRLAPSGCQAQSNAHIYVFPYRISEKVFFWLLMTTTFEVQAQAKILDR